MASAGEKALMLLGGVFIGQQLFTATGQWLYSNVQLAMGTPTVDTSKFAQSILTVKLPLTITNGNSIGLGIVSLKGTVTYGQIRVAEVNLPIGVAIPANGSVPIPLELDINITNVIQDLTSALQGGGGVFAALVNPLRLQAMLQTDLFNIAIPIDTNIPIA